MTKRRDNRQRLLHNGESQRKDGRYAFKYIDTFGKPQFIYSWRLVPTDKTPVGKRNDLSLREKEKILQRDIDDGIDTIGKKMTVCQLYSKHTRQRGNVKDNTEIGRNRLMKLLEEDKLGHCAIEKVNISDAIDFVIRMKEKGIAYKTISNDKRSLKATFYTAIRNNCIRTNPFDFQISEVLKDDTKPKVPLTQEQEDSLLLFIQSDNVYYKYYDDVILLLETGLRISEFCGLTEKDIDFENRLINVDHQLLRNKKRGYYIEEPKTEKGKRKIPMSEKAYIVFKRVIERSKKYDKSITIDGYSGFIFIKNNGYPKVCCDYDSVFRGIKKKYNKKSNSIALPNVMTPHTLRHTFCTNWANAGMNPHTLQYIMGHANILITLSYYTHPTYMSAQAEMERIRKQQQIYYSCTTFESENIKSNNNLCEYLPQLKMS